MQTNDAETAEQIAALESVVSGLAKLEDKIANKRSSKIAALARFADGNSHLVKLEELHERRLAQLDIFSVLGVTHSELHHSRFLRWLLDPQETHGVEDNFLKSFLLRTCATAEAMGLPTVTPAYIEDAKWSSTEVRREWQYIDILILNRKARFVCAVENKICAGEGIGPDGESQLTRYREALETNFPDFNKHYVFLSPSGMSSQIPEERKYWTPERHANVVQLVEQTIADNVAGMSDEVRVFLRQYVETLRRNNIVPDSSELQQLARQIYMEHREAIELIYRHRPDYLSEMKQMFKELISQQNKWLLDVEGSSFVRFRSSDWDCFEVQKTGTGWLPQSSALLLFQINFRDGPSNLPYLDLGLSPAPNEVVRRKLFDNAQQNPELFRPRSPNFGTSWMVLDAKDYILDDSDYGPGWDDGTTRAKIEAWVKNFAENEFPAMNDVIVKCLEEYEAETNGG